MCFENGEKSAKKELLYDGVYYDVTNWIKRHPGGGVIETYTSTGEDSTHAVQQFHHRSTKEVMNIMNSLPNRPATAEDLNIDSEKSRRHSALTKDFLELYQELQAEGMFKPDYLHSFLRVSEIFLLLFTGAYLYMSSSQISITKIAGFLLVTFAAARSGWVMHEASHTTLTGIPKLDRYMRSFFYGLFYGFSGSFWVHQHSTHHAMPQHLKYDFDLKMLPVVAFHPKVVKNPEQGKGFMLQNQQWLMVPLNMMLIPSYWKFFLHPRYCLLKKNYFDLFCMAMHYVIAFGILKLGLVEFFVASYLSSVYSLLNIMLSHTYLPVTEEPSHWVESSLLYTANIRSSWWVDYWMAYLNYQIEHHLFPTMPQFRNKLCRDRVKALAKKHNLPYNLYSYGEGVVKIFENLGEVSKELALQ